MLSKDRSAVKYLMMLLSIIIGQVPSGASACPIVCWNIIPGDVIESGDCGCQSGHCGDYFQMYQINYCGFVSSGAQYCAPTPLPVGYRWDCNEGTNYCGIVACYLLNAGVCVAQCYAALSACVACAQGLASSWDCSEAAISCGQCLTGEGIDCGCLDVWCEIGEVTHIVVANSAQLSGGSCYAPSWP